MLQRNGAAPVSAMDDRERLIELICEGVTNPEARTKCLARLADELHAADASLGLKHIATHVSSAAPDVRIDRSLHDTYAPLAPGNRIWQAIGRTKRPMADQVVMRKSNLVNWGLSAAQRGRGGETLRRRPIDAASAGPAYDDFRVNGRDELVYPLASSGFR